MEAVARGLEAGAVPQTARILLVAPPARGGLARHVISLLAALHQEGYELGVASDPEGPIAEAARERSLPFYGVSVSGVNPSRAAVGALQIAGAISGLQAQIIHSHSFSASLISALAAPLARSARLVATIHNYPPDATGMRAARAQHRWALRQVVRRAARLITVSDALRSDLLALHPGVADKAITIPNGIEIGAMTARDPAAARSALGLPGDAALVGMVARLAPQKGIPEFIRACRLVADRWPEVQFVLAGDGPLREEAASLQDELALGERLHLVEAVNSTGDLIAALDLLVVASTSEGSSLVAMEAMAREKPVVATRVGGVPEVVADGNTGVLVQPGDPAALAEGIEALLRDPERAHQMGQRGRRRVAERFDLHQMLERTKQVYAGLLREQIKTKGGAT